MANRVLVTAGASGIGLAIARAFAATGAQVFVCDIDRAALKGAIEDIPGLSGCVCDISQRPSRRLPCFWPRTRPSRSRGRFFRSTATSSATEPARAA